MHHGRFFGFCIMVLAGILFLVQGYISYGPKSAGERARLTPPTEINQPPPESTERANMTPLILSGILFLIGGGMYYSEVRRLRPTFVRNGPEGAAPRWPPRT